MKITAQRCCRLRRAMPRPGAALCVVCWLLCAIGSVSSGLGCKPQVRTWPISGEVRFVDKQGEAIPAGQNILVSFRPDGDNQNRPGAQAMTDSQGRFQGSLILRPGQDHPGRYKAILAYPFPPDSAIDMAPGSKPPPRRPIPIKYEDFQTSPLVVQLGPGNPPTVTLDVIN
jgi:hypothetical protein